MFLIWLLNISKRSLHDLLFYPRGGMCEWLNESLNYFIGSYFWANIHLSLLPQREMINMNEHLKLLIENRELKYYYTFNCGIMEFSLEELMVRVFWFWSNSLSSLISLNSKEPFYFNSEVK